MKSSIIRLNEDRSNFKLTLKTSQTLNLELGRLIDEKDLEGLVRLFNAILTESLSPQTRVFEHENDVRDLIYSHLPELPVIKSREQPNLKGNSDLELKTKNTHLVLEFKRSYEGKSEESALK